MAVRKLAIDYAAGGFLRHRFVRAFSASIAVFFLTGIVYEAATFFLTPNDSFDLALAHRFGPIGGFAIELAMIIVGAFVGGGISALIVDTLHRRLVAFVILTASFIFALVFGLI